MVINESLAIASASLLGVVYCIMALVSMGHIRRENKALLSRRILVFFFWWPFYGDLYESSAKKLRLVGVLIFIVIVVMYVLWFNLHHANTNP